MRNSTKNIVSALGLGTLAMSYVIGMNSATAGGFSASGISGEGVSIPTAAESAKPAASATASASPSESTSSETKPSAAPSASSTKKNSSSSGSSTTAPKPSAPVTKSGSEIKYKFGAVQISVTKTGGKITAVDLLQGASSKYQEDVFPVLQQAALAAQGSGFGNYSSATATTEAFKQALDSALSKF